MATQDNVISEIAAISERVTKVETTLETERPHLATKADLERHTRLIVMWMIATQIAIVGIMLTIIGNWISSIG